ncbi:MAG: hypothetical protein K6G11_04305 [Lachnospiraceae bacterium]|nr:hypothetical protein [Lachnospiraceae bacterium]
MKKKLLSLLMVLALSASTLTGCLDELDTSSTESSNKEAGSEDESWAIYWYLCGSDLESQNGFATTDIAEALDVNLPDNVTIVIQTGGASEWQNDEISADSISRYEYCGENFEKVDEQKQASMGDASTLASFLKFCNKNYPADHKMVLFWDHGGGSTSGVSLDENYDGDYLSIAELRQAFEATCKPNKKNQPYDIIGFDTCLMATIDVVNIFTDIGKYLVASEETEPGIGWAYDKWLKVLAKDTSITPQRLGKTICDTYYETCEEYDLADEVTLSVTDLTKANDVVEIYNLFGQEAFLNAAVDSRFFTDLSRAASRTENYGCNTDKGGYTDMADLGDLAANASDILPISSQNLIDAIDNAVIYKVNGKYRDHASGISCYYSYSGYKQLYKGFKKASTNEGMNYLYQYEFTGNVSDAGYEYLMELVDENDAEGSVPETNNIQKETLDPNDVIDHPVKITRDNYSKLILGSEISDYLAEVNFQLAIIDKDEDVLVFLGSDNDITANWNKGVFTENFRQVWGAIDDHLVYMEVVSSNEDYTTYNVPILLNGEPYNLRVIYDYNAEDFEILGARTAAQEDGMTDKDLIKLQPGDEITTVHYATSLSEEMEPVEFEMDTFEVTEDTHFGETDLGDGYFALLYEMVDSENNTYTSEPVFFTLEDGIMEYDNN